MSLNAIVPDGITKVIHDRASIRQSVTSRVSKGSSMEYAVVATLLLVLCGCSAGGDATSNQAGTPSTNLNVSPSSMTFSSTNPQPASFSVQGSRGALTVRSSDPALVNVTNVTASSFTVAAVAGGTATLTVTDGAGDSGTADTTMPTCVPPEPAWDTVYPSPGATGVSSPGSVWAAVVDNGDPVNSQMTNFYVRLLGSDGTSITSGQFTITSPPTPPGSKTLPPGYTYIYAKAAVSALSAHLTYQIQYLDEAHPCLPPLTLGSFST